MRVHVLVLNYNGVRLLAECLPSVLEAARASIHRCDVVVIDNDSRDASVVWLGEHFPSVRVVSRPNRGLCSFNDVLPLLDGPAALLLNNDIKLHRDSIDPLVAPLACTPRTGRDGCFLTAPRCFDFDGQYEGFLTAVWWHRGLMRGTALFPGHEAAARTPGWTASAGAALAVDRRVFVELGGFDPLYLPGRIEDLDFAFRGFLRGYHGRYVPEAVVWHRGMASFGPAFGPEGCDHLALRNTLLFQWKNLRTARSLLRQAAWLGVRLIWDPLAAPFAPAGRRWAFTRALAGALARVGRLRDPRYRPLVDRARETEFLARFRPHSVLGAAAVRRPGRCAPGAAATVTTHRGETVSVPRDRVERPAALAAHHDPARQPAEVMS